MTKQSQQAHKAIMAAMKTLDEPMPSVGIFRYDEHWDLGHGWSGDFK